VRSLIFIVLILAGCQKKQSHPPLVPAQFDGQHAFAHVQAMVNFGPRPSGSPALQNSADYIKNQLQGFGLVVEQQEFVAETPLGPKTFRNIIGKTQHLNSDEKEIILFGTHYDTKLMSDIVFVGANDGGSGVGVLLEMAKLSAKQPDVWFVFFDGEECMVSYSESDGLWGSKHFVESLQAEKKVSSIQAMVLFDMVGDKNLNVTIPNNSDPSLIQLAFEAARIEGTRTSFSLFGSTILDDHQPFLKAGIPAIDLIDFKFGSGHGRNDYWHTSEDTIDKVQPESLSVVGRTGLRMLNLLQEKDIVR